AAGLVGGVDVTIPISSLRWDAGKEASNYDAVRAQVLDMSPETFLLESASHESLSDTKPVGLGNDTIDAVVSTFCERAAAYGDGNFHSTTCITAATASLGASDAVSAVCPRAALGNVAPSQPCTETTAPPAVDPSTLRCGAGADDLAVALSGAVPKQ